MGELHGSMKRKLYARMAAHGGNAKSHKTACFGTTFPSHSGALSRNRYRALRIDRRCAQ